MKHENMISVWFNGQSMCPDQFTRISTNSLIGQVNGQTICVENRKFTKNSDPPEPKDRKSIAWGANPSTKRTDPWAQYNFSEWIIHLYCQSDILGKICCSKTKVSWVNVLFQGTFVPNVVEFFGKKR